MLETISQNRNPIMKCNKEEILRAHNLVQQIYKKSYFYTWGRSLDCGFHTLLAICDGHIVPILFEGSGNGIIKSNKMHEILEIMDKNFFQTRFRSTNYLDIDDLKEGKWMTKHLADDKIFECYL